jgi:hypothetical protein
MAFAGLLSACAPLTPGKAPEIQMLVRNYLALVKAENHLDDLESGRLPYDDHDHATFIEITMAGESLQKMTSDFHDQADILTSAQKQALGKALLPHLAKEGLSTWATPSLELVYSDHSHPIA